MGGHPATTDAPTPPIRPAPATRLSRPWRPHRPTGRGLQRLSGPYPPPPKRRRPPHSHLVTEPVRFADLGKSGCPRPRPTPTTSPHQPRGAARYPVSYATCHTPATPRQGRTAIPPTVAGVKDASASLRDPGLRAGSLTPATVGGIRHTGRGNTGGDTQRPRETWIQQQQSSPLLTGRRPPGKSASCRCGTWWLGAVMIGRTILPGWTYSVPTSVTAGCRRATVPHLPILRWVFGDRDADVLVVVQDHGDPLEVEGFATDFGLGSLGVGGRVVGDHHAGPDVVVDRGPERPGAQRERGLAGGAGQDAAPRRLPFDLVAEGYRSRMVARAAAYGAICCPGTVWTRSRSTSALSR